MALVTVQSTAGLKGVRPLRADEVTAQAAEVLRHQRVRAIKVGALGSQANVHAVARLLRRHADVPAVVDTPMAPTRGSSRLLAARAITVLRDELLPRATLVTLNADEAAVLVGEPVRTVGEAHDAALAIARGGAKAVLVKGGHLAGASATDVLAMGGEVTELRARRIEGGAAVHGTGCTLAALVAGRLAVRPTARVDPDTLLDAVRWAKRVHHAALAAAVDVGGPMRVLVFG